MEIRRKYWLFLGMIIFIALPLFSSFVNSAGFGVTSEFTDTRVLELAPGQRYETFFRVQNTVDNAKPMSVKAELVEGLEVAKLKGNLIRSLKVGDQEDFLVEIVIPDNTDVGREYNIKVLFKQTNEQAGEGGTLQFGINIGGNFKVRVVPSQITEQPQSSSNNLIIWIIVIILIILIAWWIFRATGKSKSKIVKEKNSVKRKIRRRRK